MGNDMEKARQERYARVAGELRKVGYGCTWQQKVRNVGTLECWMSSNGPVVLVQTFEHGAGIEVYKPLTDSMLLADMDREIAALRRK